MRHPNFCVIGPIATFHRWRKPTLHTLTFGPISGVSTSAHHLKPKDIAMKLASPLTGRPDRSPGTPRPTQNNRPTFVLCTKPSTRKPTLLDQIWRPKGRQFPSRHVPPGRWRQRTLAMRTTAFPDLRIVVEDIIQDGRQVWCDPPSSGTAGGSWASLHRAAAWYQAVDIHEFKDGDPPTGTPKTGWTG